jgi:hypothetical protein
MFILKYTHKTSTQFSQEIERNSSINLIGFPVLEFSLFRVVPTANRSHVATNPAIDITTLTTLTHTIY